ncbi:hypothetical protein QVD17_24064 [Tagetes erecta]|uniref:Small ribosomal subunit protein uS10 domain-containing protein n=1 Tax=Tagetes erecta TaxID=13708 RepID=A0AAD8KEQ9_TARER|nr:hypothetical protein QVD17_24064 [Tagetes erecta]
MTSPITKLLLKNSSSKMQITIRSFESIDKNLHWNLPPNTRKIGLPSTRSLFTVLKSPHVHKKAREQFQMKINKEMLVMETKRHELNNKFFWLKRQWMYGAQFEIIMPAFRDCLFLVDDSKVFVIVNATFIFEKYNLETLKGTMTEKDLAELARVTPDLQLDTPKALKTVPGLSLRYNRWKHIEVSIEAGEINE